MPEHVRITDVSPRDGLQNEPLRADGTPIPAPDVLKLIAALSSSGVNEIEVTSFVSPQWVPQFRDAGALLAELAGFVGRHRKTPGARGLPGYSVLVPNEKGLQACLQAQRVACASAGIDDLLTTVAVFTAASETFSKKNTNAGIDESIARLKPVVAGAQTNRLAVRGYISCAISCPYEGPIPPGAVSRVAASLAALGVDEIALGDTIGAGTPRTVSALVAAVVGSLGDHWLKRLTLHCHDTFATAAACVRQALDAGVRSFDGSAAGLGGCPYASRPGKPAPGNIATEALVRTVHDAGYITGVDPALLGRAAEVARYLVAENRGRAAKGTAR